MSLQCFMQKFDNEEVPDSFIGMFQRLSALGIRLDRHTALNYGICLLYTSPSPRDS